MKTICIMCPMGCPLDINKVGDKIVVTGNTCKRGEIYGTQEFTAPKRVVTSLVRLTSGGVVSVKTDGLVLKTLIPEVLSEIGNSGCPHRLKSATSQKKTSRAAA